MPACNRGRAGGSTTTRDDGEPGVPAEGVTSTIDGDDCHGQPEHGLRGELLARRRECYERYRAAPASVSDTWQEFFEDYKPSHILAVAAVATPAAAPACRRRPARRRPPSLRPRRRPRPDACGRPRQRPPPRQRPVADPGKLILGAGLAIANNMAKSLDVPTATSFRNVPAKLLEINRQVINGYRSRTGQGKVSFTHLIGYAIVRAIADDVPRDEQRVRWRAPTAAPRLATRARQPRPGGRRRQGQRSSRRWSPRSSAMPTPWTSPVSPRRGRGPHPPRQVEQADRRRLPGRCPSR